MVNLCFFLRILFVRLTSNSEGLDLEIFVIYIEQVFKKFRENRSLRSRATCTKIRDFCNIMLKEDLISLE